jgi:hypothetical protein
MNVGYKPNHVKFIVSILLFVYFVFNYFYGYVFFQLQLPSSLCLLTVLKIDYLLSLSMYMPPPPQRTPPKKKKKYNFYPYSLKKNLFWPPQSLKAGSAPACFHLMYQGFCIGTLRKRT